MKNRSLQTDQILRFATVIVVALVIMLIYRSSFATMWELWQRSSHQHGVLILPISAYLIWRAMPRLAAIESSWSFFGFAALAMVVTLWLIGRLAGVQVIEHFSALALIPAAVLALWGTNFFRVAMFPLLLVLLATPIGDSFIPILMSVTADISTAMLRASGYAVLRSGQQLSLPGGDFIISEVCSGVRYLMAGTTIALLFAYLSFGSWVKRLIFVAAMIVVLVLANGIRAYLVMAIGSSSNMQYMTGADHVYFGWALFGLVMLTAMWLASHYIDEPEKISSDNKSPAPKPAEIPRHLLVAGAGVLMLIFTFNPLGSEAVENGKSVLMIIGVMIVFAYAIATRRIGKLIFPRFATLSVKEMARVVIPWAIAGSFLILGPYASARVLSTASSSADYIDLHSIRSCSPTFRWSEVWVPSFENPAVEMGVTLTCGTIPTNAYVAAYSGTSKGHELVSSANLAVPNAVRTNSEVSVQEIDVGGSVHKVRELVVRSPVYQGVIWSWYEIDGQVATTAVLAKYYQLLALFRGRPAGGQMVIISTRAGSDVVDARIRLRTALEMIVLEADQVLISELP